MRNFFHPNTQKYITRRKYILWLTLLPLVQGSVIALLITIVNLRPFYEKGYLPVVLFSVGGAAVLGTLVFFTVYAVTEVAVKRIARYTYLEIDSKSLIYSRYAGDYLAGRKLEVSRKLYVMHLSALKSIGLCEKTGAIYIETEDGGIIREYHDRTERLKYKLAGGFPEFESWWYNDNGFTSLTELRILPHFGSAEISRKICEHLAEAKRKFDNAPKPKPYVHKETDYVKRKKAMDKWKKLTGV